MKIYTAHAALRLWDLIHSLPICHHQAFRSRVFGIDLPLCCRCTGVYTFIVIGFIANRFLRSVGIHQNKRLAAFVVLSLLTGAEACAEIVFGIDPGNLVRFLPVRSPGSRRSSRAGPRSRNSSLFLPRRPAGAADRGSATIRTAA